MDDLSGLKIEMFSKDILEETLNPKKMFVPDMAFCVTYPDGDQFLYLYYNEIPTTYITFFPHVDILEASTNKNKHVPPSYDKVSDEYLMRQKTEKHEQKKKQEQAHKD